MEAIRLEKRNQYESVLIVEEKHTANAFGSGDLYVFSTPMMVALMENAAMKCAELGGYATVGTSLNVKHIAATPMGHTVRATAELIEIEGKKLVFRVTAFDEKEKIGEGVHERFIIDVEKFMKKVGMKTRTL